LRAVIGSSSIGEPWTALRPADLIAERQQSLSQISGVDGSSGVVVDFVASITFG